MNKTKVLGWMVLGLLSAASAQAADGFKVGLVFDKGGKDDKSFNNSAFNGAMEAKKALGVTVSTVDAADNNAFDGLLRKFAEKKFDLVIGIGFAQMDAMAKVSKQFPDTKFAIVDAEVKNPNVRSLLFEEHEGSYLVGAIAAMLSKSGKVGFVGGMEIPLIRRFEMGYKAGAQKVNPKADVMSGFVGMTSEAWNNPTKAKEIANSQYTKGAEVVFHAAGASGLGVFDAAEEKKKLAIGVDSNQNYMKPGIIATSMLKRVDRAVFDTIQDTKNGKFSAGVKRFGLANEGVDYAIDEHNKKLLPKEVLDKVNALKKDIISGKIKVPDYYKEKNAG
jgi:basic membrane protein A